MGKHVFYLNEPGTAGETEFPWAIVVQHLMQVVNWTSSYELAEEWVKTAGEPDGQYFILHQITRVDYED